MKYECSGLFDEVDNTLKGIDVYIYISIRFKIRAEEIRSIPDNVILVLILQFVIVTRRVA